MTQSLQPLKIEETCEPDVKTFVRERDLEKMLRKNMVQNLKKPKALVNGKLKQISSQGAVKPTRRRLG